ncbi:glycosyltransferase [Aerosakkonemataceae cyanobacterium BLCC-F154]|uniref:Glycosyltransferase n=1 Tax=Floridaenema fluviatile BLCC-F154 TaxID=3153640 RepID=A0ABV4YKI6_9CYAN
MSETVKFTQSEAERQFYLAHVWQAKGKIELAIASYKKAIDLQPIYTDAYVKLTELLIEQGREEEAIAVYHQAIEANPNEANFYQELINNIRRKDSKFTDLLPLIESDSLHILFYTDCPEIYGAAQLNHAIICDLAASKYKLTCVQSQANHYLIQQRNQLRISHLWLKPDNLYHPTKPARAFSNTDEVEHIFTLAKPDLIIFGDGCPVSNLAAKEVAIQREIPYIQIVHCVTAEWAKQFQPYLQRLPNIYQHAQAVITVSEENLNLLRQQFKLPENIGQVIYNGRPAQYFNPPNLAVRDRLRQELNIPNDAIVCLTTARLDLVKGYQYQLSAIQQLQESEIWDKLYFIWAGTGNLSLRLKTLSAEMGVSDRIKFVGERSDIPDLLDTADIFILPSQFEGMPLAIMEAMAKAKPVLASAVSGIPEELGETGKLLPDPKINSSATIQELVTTIEAWATDSQLRYSIGQACKNRAEKMFKEERMLIKYKAIVEKLFSVKISGNSG